MKTQFDIAYRSWVESGEYKVVTRNDKPVRIVCWDYKTGEGEDYNIIGLVEGRPGEEFLAYYDNKGRYSHYRETAHDLFIITPEPELTGFEQSVRDMIVKELTTEFNNKDSHITATVSLDNKTAHRLSLGLLELAKKEICKGCTVGLDQYWKGKEDARKEAEKSYTFHYPTYEPPCHHGGICTNPFKDCINCPRTGGDTGISTTSGTCKKD